MKLNALWVTRIEDPHIPEVVRTDPWDHICALYDLDKGLKPGCELQGALQEDYLLQVPGI